MCIVARQSATSNYCRLRSLLFYRRQPIASLRLVLAGSVELHSAAMESPSVPPNPSAGDLAEATNFCVAYLGSAPMPKALVHLIAEKNDLRRRLQNNRRVDPPNDVGQNLDPNPATSACTDNDVPLDAVTTPVSSVKKKQRSSIHNTVSTVDRERFFSNCLAQIKKEAKKIRFFPTVGANVSKRYERRRHQKTIPGSCAISPSLFEEVFVGGVDKSKSPKSVLQVRSYDRKELMSLFSSPVDLTVKAQPWLKDDTRTGRPEKFGDALEKVPIAGVDVKYNRRKQVTTLFFSTSCPFNKIVFISRSIYAFPLSARILPLTGRFDPLSSAQFPNAIRHLTEFSDGVEYCRAFIHDNHRIISGSTVSAFPP